VKRCKKSPKTAPAYPHIRAFIKRYGRRVGTGLVVGAVATTAGCDWLEGGVLFPKPEVDTGEHLDGMVAETAETWNLQLPLDGSRDLYFADPYGWVQYRLSVVVDGGRFYDWLRLNAEEVLAAVDEVLRSHEVTTFEHDDGYDAVEDEIANALVLAWVDAEGGGGGYLLSVELHIDAYEDEDDILGDQEATK
jgi:hypothetical protein